MIINTLSTVLFVIFSLLGILHFYWLVGGNWGLKQVIPSKGKEFNTLAIPKFATLLVGLALISFGLIYLIKSGIVTTPLSIQKIFGRITNFGYWFIPSIFILRAIGEFNYVGFFKKVKHTEFAKFDSKLFSPLCLGIGICGILIQLIS